MQRGFVTIPKKIILLVILSVTTVLSFAQSVAVSSLQKKFSDYNGQLLQEKIYAHTDKNFYLAGELMWFKLYFVDGFFNKSLDVSKVAYAEVLDKSNKPVLQGKIALRNGSGNGSFFLPVTLQSGQYKLRSYTNWMKNFDAQYFFEKTITVINPQRVPDQPVADSKIKYDLQFFPEGGSLVNGLQSTVAFRIANQYGKGVDATGSVVNSAGDTVVRFTTSAFGLGSFVLTPVAGVTYNAVVVCADGNRLVVAIPQAINDGVVMHVSAAAQGKINVHVAGSPSQTGEILLLAHTRNAVKSVQSVTMQNGQASFVVEEDKLGEGVSHFTLFNASQKPMSERLYFRYPASLKIDAVSSRERPDQRSKVNIDISTFVDNKPAQSDLSMSVYRIDSLHEADPFNIQQYLWLVSDLHGTVESPEFYFDEKQNNRKEMMDLLMLTHGWRKFAWNDLLSDKKPLLAYTPEFNGHVVNGRVVNAEGKPEQGKVTYLSVPSTKTLFRGTISDELGRVKFEMKEFYGSSEIVAQFVNEADTLNQVEIQSPFADKYSSNPLPLFNLPARSPATLTDDYVSTQVRNVYTAGRQQRFIDLSDSSNFYGNPDMRYMLDDYTRFTTMEEVFREYVLPVNVRRKDGRFHLPVFDEVTRTLFQGDPLVLVDGVFVNDFNKLMNYDPHKISKLEVVSRKYFFGNFSYDGVVNMHTYGGDVAVNELDPHAVIIDYEGLQMQREFFSPLYETPQQIANRVPDFRTLLFWSHDAGTDANGKRQVSFFTSDIPGKYVVIVQGISTDGKTGSRAIYFDVKDVANIVNK